MKKMSLSIFALVFTLPLSANEGVKKLKEFHKNVKSFQAQFEQKLFDEHSKEIQGAQGNVSLLRPGKFRWDYSKPDKQLIVSNGTKLWIYDEALAQVTVKGLERGIGQAPARVLSDSKPLESEFKLKDLGKKDGIDWVELTPKTSSKQEQKEFQWVHIGFGKTLQQMKVRDNLSQTTVIIFSQLKQNVKLDPSQFVFTVPQGVDVVGDPTQRKQEPPEHED